MAVSLLRHETIRTTIQKAKELRRVVEPLITLASLVHLVPDLRLGTSTLVLPQRNALLVAKQVAALDVL